jgi:hypothetical protein
MRNEVYGILVLATSVVMCQLALAERSRPMDEQELHEMAVGMSIKIDGSETPELVPDAVRMKVFFFRYGRYRSALQKEISAADDAVLSAYSDVHAQTIANDEVKRRAAYDEIMSRAETMSGIDLAVAFESAYQQSQALAKDRYDAILNRLSPEGKQAVKEFAYAHVRPSMMLSNQVALAMRSPEAFKRAVICAYQESRELASHQPTEQPAEASRDDSSAVDSDSLRISY